MHHQPENAFHFLFLHYTRCPWENCWPASYFFLSACLLRVILEVCTLILEASSSILMIWGARLMQARIYSSILKASMCHFVGVSGWIRQKIYLANRWCKWVYLSANGYHDSGRFLSHFVNKGNFFPAWPRTYISMSKIRNKSDFYSSQFYERFERVLQVTGKSIYRFIAISCRKTVDTRKVDLGHLDLIMIR